MAGMLSTTPPAITANHSTHHSNGSSYTLASVRHDAPDSPLSDHAPLLDPEDQSSNASYGTTDPVHPRPRSSRRLLFNAALKMALIFILSTAVLGGTLWLALPRLDEEDRPLLRVPKSFEQLQGLNYLLKKYRDIYPVRVVVCYVVTYLFLQAYSLPGSMYLSILGGAVWGVPIALPLACTCVATGASLCYLISAAFGPALLTFPKVSSRLERFSHTVDAQRANLLSFLIVLRIAPLPPHWIANVLCPHVGIGLPIFWVSTWLGMVGVTVIHTTIGSGLDQMTSAKDFHLISWRNFFILAAIVVGVLIPVGLRYYFKRELAEVAEIEHQPSRGEVALEGEDDTILASGPAPVQKKGKATAVADQQLVLLSDSDSDGEYGDEDGEEDIILEAGPALDAKPKDSSEPR